MSVWSYPVLTGLDGKPIVVDVHDLAPALRPQGGHVTQLPDIRQFEPDWPALRLTEAVVSSPGYDFTDETPGEVLEQLLVAAQARGALAELHWKFTPEVDSNGDPWLHKLTCPIEQFANYYDAFMRLVDYGVMTFEVGYPNHEVKAFNVEFAN